MAKTKISNVKNLERVSFSNAPKKNDEKSTAPLSRIKKDKSGRYIVTARRKAASVTIWVDHDKVTKKPQGIISVDGRSLDQYFDSPIYIMTINQPFELNGLNLNDYRIEFKALGGGKSAQSQALRLAISWFLSEKLQGARTLLKAAGLCTRDPRVVEPKKYGKRKARRPQQWVKR